MISWILKSNFRSCFNFLFKTQSSFLTFFVHFKTLSDFEKQISLKLLQIIKPTFTIFLGSVDFFCMLVWRLRQINFFRENPPN